MNKTNWHIINITGGRTLDAHDLLMSNAVPCLMFVKVCADLKPTREKRGKRQLVAVPAFTNYLFADLSAIQSQMTLTYLRDRKSYIHGAWGKTEQPNPEKLECDPTSWLYAVNDAEFDGIRGIKNETGRRKDKPTWEVYDRQSHSRFNLNRLHGQGVVVPQFTVGEQVEFYQGGMRGLIFEVDEIDVDGKVHLTGEAAFFGGVTKLKVENPFMLKKVA